MDLAVLGVRVEANGVLTATNGLNNLTAAGGRTEAAFGKLKSAAASLGLVFGAGMAFRTLIRETTEAQDALAQLESAVRATGGAAGRSVPQLTAMAAALQRVSRYSDEAVMGAQNILLAFNKIRGETFDRATRAATDLAAKFGVDLPSAAMQLGKALQEPGEALSVLQRQYRLFTVAEVESIKRMAEHGQAAEAQAAILQRLESRVGGTAAAMRNTLGGALAGLRNAFGDLLEVSRGGTGGVVGALNAMTKALEDNAGAIRNVAVAAGVLGGAFVAMKAAVWLGVPAVAALSASLFQLQASFGVATALGLTGFARVASGLEYGLLPALGRVFGKLSLIVASLWALDRLRALFRDIETTNRGAQPTSGQAVGGAWAGALAEAARVTGRPTGALAGLGVTDPSPVLRAAAKSAKELADELKTLQQRKLELLAVDAELERAAIAAARTALAEADAQRELTQAVRERADVWVAELRARTALLNISDREKAAADWRKAKEGRGAGGGIDWTQALPTVGGLDLGALLSSPKSFGMDIFSGILTDALDAMFHGAERAAAALRQFTLNMEAFRAAMTGDALAASIAAVRAQAEGMRAQVPRDRWGRTEEYNAAIAEINRLEAVRIVQLEHEAAVIEHATKVAERNAVEDLAVRALRAQGLDAEADALAFALAQQREMNDLLTKGASEAEAARFAEIQRQEAIRHTAEVAIAAARKEADAAASRLATAQSALEGTRATLEGLRAYSATLRGLTGSPATNLATSRAAFEALATRARTGDQTAIAGLQGAGTTFLEQSRAYNASGMGYQRDVAAVQAVVDEVAQNYQDTATLQERIVAALVEQNRIAQEQLTALQDAEFARQLANAEAYYEAAYTAAAAAGDTAAMLSALAGLERWQREAEGREVDRMLNLSAAMTTGSAAQQTVLYEILWALDRKAAETGLFPSLPLDPLTGEPVGSVGPLLAPMNVTATNTGNTVARLETTVATLAAGFTQVSGDLADTRTATVAALRRIELALETGGLR